MNNLLIDVGSTFIKYCVFDTLKNEEILFDKIKFPDALSEKDKHYTVSVKEIIKIIDEIFLCGIENNCKKAFISVQMHGYVLRENNAFSEYISWRDKSGNVNKKEFLDVDFDKFGTSLKENLPLTKIETDKEQEFFTLGSFIAWHLTKKNATHITDACASGFFNACDGSKNRFCNIVTMPKVYNTVEVLGKYYDIEIFTPIGDHQISFLGSRANEEKYLLNIGTATQISCVADFGFIGKCEKRPYFNNKRLYTVSGLIGGYQIESDENKERLLLQIKETMKNLPPKSTVLIGGGGGEIMYDFISKSNTNISCELINHNIGMEGLKMISKENNTKIGTMLSEITFPNFPIIAKNANLNFMIIDAEHGAFDYSALSSLIMTANLINFDTIIRIGDASRANITKLADTGAHGFLLPMTNTAEDIANVVKYAKYSPIGQRGISTTRPHTMYNPPELQEYMKSANEKMKIYAQIETKAGVDNIESILSVNGVEGVLIGPNDLSCDLNCIGNKYKIIKCIKAVSSAADKQGKVWGIITADKDYLSASKELGANMVSIGSELNMLISGCKNLLSKY